jgi:hypothetical protein
MGLRSAEAEEVAHKNSGLQTPERATRAEHKPDGSDSRLVESNGVEGWGLTADT